MLVIRIPLSFRTLGSFFVSEGLVFFVEAAFYHRNPFGLVTLSYMRLLSFNFLSNKFSGVCMHSAFCCGSKMFQSSVDVVWKWCHSSFKVASKMFESGFKSAPSTHEHILIALFLQIHSCS